jgi:putative RecB family exonuclease
MPLEPPRALSPSKVAAFTDCAMAFRFSAIDRLAQRPTVPAVRGSLVHAALERLLAHPAPERTVPTALACLSQVLAALSATAEWEELALPAEEALNLADESAELLRRYFLLEDPRTVLPIGLELALEADIGGRVLRGIIDRLELDERGELVVTDYKTGRAPGAGFERPRLEGLHLYALLCEHNFGRRPARVQLLHLHEPVAVLATPSDLSTLALERKLDAIWAAIELACEHDDFAPRRSWLCDWCSFKAYCPAWGGDPARAADAQKAPASPLDLVPPASGGSREVRVALGPAGPSGSSPWSSPADR